VIKLLDVGIIYPIFDSKWVSPIHVMPKKAGITVIKNKDNKLVPTRVQLRWKVCIDYRKLNTVTREDHFPLPFIDQIVERLDDHAYYCFLWMATPATIKYCWILKTKKRLRSLVLSVHLPIIVCRSGCVMHLLLFSDA
jgi:hypothetical protein